jgi:ferric-dicitrate binding protein FerR (iron transport regulator)
MENEINHIDLLIANCLSGEASEIEKKELSQWLEVSSANKKHFEEYKRIWDNSQTYISKPETLSDQLQIKDRIISQLVNEKPERNSLFWLNRVAAILAIPVMLGIGWYIGNSGNKEDIICEVSTPKGHISRCTLADGTEVWLNAGSTLKYPSTMNGNLREVNLDGEAYFKVSKNKHKPFIVNTQLAQVKVLGTVFNLKAYSSDKNVETTLEEGSVEFKLNNNPKDPIELKPGEQVIFNKSDQKLAVNKVDTYLHTAWKDGKYVFKDAELKDIITELERLYDVKFHVQNDSLLHMHFRGMFEYELNIFSALERLETTTNMKYKIDGRNIWLQ